MHTLAAELANEQTDPHIRNAAGLAFKNALAARVRLPLRLRPVFANADRVPG